MVGITPPENSRQALQDGIWLRGLANGQNRGSINKLVAHAGGSKATAFQIPAAVELVSFGTVATTGDSALLPQAKAGTIVMVANNGAQTLDLYGKGTDTVNNVATATAYTLATTVAAIFFCAVDGAWFAVKSA